MRIALYAPFQQFSDTYSLAHVVVEQAAALRAAGADVQVWTNRAVKPASGLTSRIADAVVPALPDLDLESDRTDPARTSAIAQAVFALHKSYAPDAVVTHDAVFQAGYVEHAAAMHLTARATADAAWLHYCHSAVGPGPHAPPTADTFPRRRLPDRHFAVCPSESLRSNVAGYFDARPERVLHVPNPRDPRAYWSLADGVEPLVTDLGLHLADAVQVYPFCMTRAADKGVPELVDAFASLKSLGLRVRLLLCAANAQDLDAEVAALRGRTGLGPEELVFVHQRSPRWRFGVPNRVVADLLRFANLFVFPTRAEACSLALAEAQAAGCLCVLNSAVPPLAEYADPAAIMHDFARASPDRWEANPAAPGAMIRGVGGHAALARRIADALAASPAHAARRHAARTYSWEAVGRRLVGAVGDARKALGLSFRAVPGGC